MCTKIGIVDKSNNIAVFVRTMDFASPTGINSGLIKAGTKISLTGAVEFSNNGSVANDALNNTVITVNDFKAKFTDIGFTIGIKHFGIRMVSDGMNKTLSVSTLWLPDTTFETDTNAKNTISGLTLPQYLLGMFSSVEEVLKFFGAVKTTHLNGEDGYIGSNCVSLPIEFIKKYATIHFHIADNTGAAYVIEFETRDGKKGVPVFYKCDNNVLTNGPKYIFHRMNESNYVAKTSVTNITSGKILGKSIDTAGYGNNLQGLPADPLPASRYISSLILLSNAIAYKKPTTQDEAKLLLDKVIAKTVVIKGTSANSELTGMKYDWTQWISMHDMINFKLYQKDDTSLNWVELECKPLNLTPDYNMLSFSNDEV